MTAVTLDEVLADFILELEELAAVHGREQVLMALHQLEPDFEIDDETFLVEQGPVGGLSSLGARTGRDIGKMVLKKWNKWKAAREVGKVVPIAGTGAAAGAGTAGGAAAGGLAGIAAVAGISVPALLAAAAVWKGRNQDVNIDDITTDAVLNVKSDSLEQMLIDTNAALETLSQVFTQTQQQLADKLDSIDASVDDSIASETGESTKQVQARQAAGLKKPEKEKSKKDAGKEEKKPKSPVSVV